MNHHNPHRVLLLWILILLSKNCQSWGWFFSSKETHSSQIPSENTVISNDIIAEFSMEPLDSKKGIKLVENAQRKLVSSNSCWQNAYKDLFAGCSEILAVEEKRSRLAWHLSDCFQKDSGRPPFPRCDVKSLMVICLKKLDEDARKIYLEFYLEANSISYFYRGTLQQLAEFGHRQQEELLQRQKQLERAHDHLWITVSFIFVLQKAFESKQATMFLAIDKLFTLHNAILFESRLIKSFFVYSISIFILYMFTSTKQTYTVRPRLYIGLCATFLIEASILRYAANDIEQQAWMVSLVRSLFALLAAAQLLHAIFTYRDYEVMNHQILLTLMEKVNGMQRNKELSWEMDSDSDSDANWSSWVETELPEDVDLLEDPDYMLPAPEEVGENWISTTSITRKYNLRHRSHRL